MTKQERRGFKVGPEAQQRFAERLRAQQQANGESLTRRLVAAYLAEPDREYAEDMWGSMLKERGVDVVAVETLKELAR